jgi:hypothetical protein
MPVRVMGLTTTDDVKIVSLRRIKKKFVYFTEHLFCIRKLVFFHPEADFFDSIYAA